jgi:hypothetical protein
MSATSATLAIETNQRCSKFDLDQHAQTEAQRYHDAANRFRNNSRPVTSLYFANLAILTKHGLSSWFDVLAVDATSQSTTDEVCEAIR